MKYVEHRVMNWSIFKKIISTQCTWSIKDNKFCSLTWANTSFGFAINYYFGNDTLKITTNHNIISVGEILLVYSMEEVSLVCILIVHPLLNPKLRWPSCRWASCFFFAGNLLASNVFLFRLICWIGATWGITVFC